MKRLSRRVLAIASAIPTVLALAAAAFQQMAPDAPIAVGLPFYIVLAALALAFGGLAMTSPSPSTLPHRSGSAFIDGVIGGDSVIIGNSSNARIFARGGVQDRARIENNTHTPPEDES